jgi:predicted nucleotidyltransferase
LRLAKEQLGVSWDELAVANGINPRALKTYRMPDTSKDYRALPDLARSAIAPLLEDRREARAKPAGQVRNAYSNEIHVPEILVKPSVALNAHRAEIRRIVEANRAVNARVFGSVLHGEDTEESDLDILVDPTPEMTLLNIGSIRHQLLQLLGVSVDVLTPNGLPEKFRAEVMAEAVPV